MNWYFFTYGSTNNKVESLSTNETAQRSLERIIRWLLPGSSGTNRTPADPPGPSTSTVPEFFVVFFFGLTPFFWQKAVLWTPTTWSDDQNSTPWRGTQLSYPRWVKATLAYVMGRQLSHRGYHLATVSRGHPSIFNGHRQLFHLGYLLLVISRGHPSLFNGYMKLFHLGYLLVMISRGHPSLFNGHRELLHLAYLFPTVSRGHPHLCNGHRQFFHLGYLLFMFSRGRPSLFNGHRELLHLAYLLNTVSRDHPSLFNRHMQLFHLAYFLPTVSRGHPSVRGAENDFNVE